MKKCELEQIRMTSGRSAIYQREQENYMPTIDMQLVDLRTSRSHDYGRERQDQGNNILIQEETAGAADSGEFSHQIIRMSAMTELKKFSGREKNEERARKCISKLKSAYLLN